MAPVHITFRNLKPSQAVASTIESEAEKLDKFYPRITSCRVIVEVPHRHHRHGALVHVSIILNVPRAEIVINRDPGGDNAPVLSVDHDIYAEIHHAFKTARRRLEDYARCLRGDHKALPES